MLKPLFISLCILSPSVWALDATTELLFKKGIITPEEYAQLQANEAKKATVEVSGEGLKITSADKTASAQIGLLVQLDYAGYNSDITDNTGHDLANAGSEFRRARLNMMGNLAADWEYRFQVDFANGSQLADAYVTYKGWQPLSLYVGHQVIPFSQEAQTADRNLSFMERSLASNFLVGRAPGLMLLANRDNWSAQAMVFGEQLSTPANALSDESTGASLRFSWAPLLSNDYSIHLAAAGMERIPNQNNLSLGSGSNISYTEAVRFRAKPESNIIDTRLIDTGAIGIIDVENTRLWGAELGASLRSWQLMAEYIDTRVARRYGKPELEFTGWYAMAAWTITGEGRRYLSTRGTFDGIKPSKPTTAGGSGAWELAVRVSELDLTDGPESLVAGKWVNEINGGAQRDLTLALNWYLTNSLRIGANYVKVLYLEGGPFDGRDLDAIQMRFQFAY